MVEIVEVFMIEISETSALEIERQLGAPLNQDPGAEALFSYQKLILGFWLHQAGELGNSNILLTSRDEDRIERLFNKFWASDVTAPVRESCKYWRSAVIFMLAGCTIGAGPMKAMSWVEDSDPELYLAMQSIDLEFPPRSVAAIVLQGLDEYDKFIAVSH